jgi:hypothetical protein
MQGVKAPTIVIPRQKMTPSEMSIVPIKVRLDKIGALYSYSMISLFHIRDFHINSNINILEMNSHPISLYNYLLEPGIQDLSECQYNALWTCYGIVPGIIFIIAFFGADKTDLVPHFAQ